MKVHELSLNTSFTLIQRMKEKQANRLSSLNSYERLPQHKPCWGGCYTNLAISRHLPFCPNHSRAQESSGIMREARETQALSPAGLWLLGHGTTGEEWRRITRTSNLSMSFLGGADQVRRQTSLVLDMCWFRAGASKATSPRERESQWTILKACEEFKLHVKQAGREREVSGVCLHHNKQNVLCFQRTYFHCLEKKTCNSIVISLEIILFQKYLKRNSNLEYWKPKKIDLFSEDASLVSLKLVILPDL